MNSDEEIKMQELAELLLPQTSRIQTASAQQMNNITSLTMSPYSMAILISKILYKELGESRFTKFLDTYRLNPSKFRAIKTAFNTGSYAISGLSISATLDKLSSRTQDSKYFELPIYISLLRFEAALRDNDYDLDKILEAI